MRTATCTQCGLDVPLDAFARDRRTRTGLASVCRACKSARSAEWYERVRIHRGAKQRTRRQRARLLRKLTLLDRERSAIVAQLLALGVEPPNPAQER